MEVWENSALSGLFPHAIFKIWHDQSAMAIHTTLQVIKKRLSYVRSGYGGSICDQLRLGQWGFHEGTSWRFRHNRDCFNVTAVFVSFWKCSSVMSSILMLLIRSQAAHPPIPAKKGRTARWVVYFLMPFSRFGMISLLWQYIQPCKWSKSGWAMCEVAMVVASVISCD